MLAGRRLVPVFAVACGLAVGNLYYAQPLLATIGAAFGVSDATAGLIVTVTQLGYAFGLIALVPLGDLVENRRLVLAVLAGTVASLAAAAAAPTFPAFLAASFAIGVTSVVAQVLVPLAAHFAPEDARGRVVGQVMSGLLAGILLARALAGAIAGVTGWRGVYVVSAVLIALTIAVLARVVPARTPAFSGGARALYASLVTIFRKEPVLRRRAAYQALMFATFSAFWTCVTFLLSAAPYRLSSPQIGLFALAGALGALVAPVAGRVGDAGHGRAASGLAFLVGAAGFATTLVPAGLWSLVLGAILIDVAVQASLVLGQQAIYALDPAERGRLNTLYVALFFFGGAAGSALGGAAYERARWPGVAALGIVLPALAFAIWLTDREKPIVPVY